MQHEVGLSWGFYALQWGYLALVALAGWMVFDSTRLKRRLTHQALAATASREPLWIYQLTGVLFVISAAAGYIPAVPPVVRMAAIFAAPFLFFIVMVYLLRVVFPKSSAEPKADDTFSIEE